MLSVVVGSICALAGATALRFARRGSRVALFCDALDPDRGLQRAYGAAGLFAAAATLTCPFLPHAALPLVHPAIGWLCIALALMLAPRLFYAYVMSEVLAPTRT